MPLEYESQGTETVSLKFNRNIIWDLLKILSVAFLTAYLNIA